MKTPFPLYFGLIETIPIPWKSMLKKAASSHTSEKTEEKYTMKISTKTVYSAFLKDIFSPPTAQSKILRYGFTHDNIYKVYKLPFRLKNDIRITVFQYKIIDNILTTNVGLFRAKICDHDVCPQCLTDRHSLDHMFLHCPSTLVFCSFQNWRKTKANVPIRLSDSMILYGVFDMNLYSLNYMLLIAKFYIYNNCLHNKKLSFDSFLVLLKERINIQREIAIVHNKISTFNKTYEYLL